MSRFLVPARRRHRRFAAESLEARCLLSAFISEVPLPLPSPATADAVSSVVDAQERDQLAEYSASHGVRVLEIEPVDNEGDFGHEIRIAELPEAVVAGVNSRLPGATIEGAETDADDGTPMFEVHVEFHGMRLDVKLSPDGEVLKVKQPLPVAALPDSLRDWIASNLSGGSVLEVERVFRHHSVRYTLLIATSEQQIFDATFRLANGDRPRQLPPSDDAIGRDAEQPSTAEQVTPRTRSARVVSVASVSPKGPQTTQHEDDRPANDAAAQRSWDAAVIKASADETHSDHTEATCVVAVSDTSETTLQVMSFSLTNATSATKLSLMARVLTDVLPQDLATIERGLQEFLNGVNSLTDMTGEGSAVHRWLLPLLTVAAALYGAERLIRERRKSTRNPVLGTAGQSSWTWVLNLSSSSDSKEK